LILGIFSWIFRNL